MANFIKDFFSHYLNAGSYNEGEKNQVSTDDLPEHIRPIVDELGMRRDMAGPEERAQIQEAINQLYNPRTRDHAYRAFSQASPNTFDYSKLSGLMTQRR